MGGKRANQSHKSLMRQNVNKTILLLYFFRWYRARVQGTRPGNEYDVFYVDYGDREWITGNRVKPPWREILQLPLQAIECSLGNVVPLGKTRQE